MTRFAIVVHIGVIMNFVANLPYTKVWIKKEYLYDLEKGFDEEPVEGVLVAVKSMQGRALMFESIST